jgi:hypothetical protein
LRFLLQKIAGFGSWRKEEATRLLYARRAQRATSRESDPGLHFVSHIHLMKFAAPPI